MASSIAGLLLLFMSLELGSCIVVVADNGTKVRFEDSKPMAGQVKRSGYTQRAEEAVMMMLLPSHKKRDSVNQIRDDVKEVKTLKGEPSQVYGSAIGGGYGGHHHGGYHGSSNYGSTGHGVGPGPAYGGGGHHGGGLLPPGGLYGGGHHGAYGDHPIEQPPYDSHHHEPHHHDSHHHHDIHIQKQQAIKSLLIPLVGVALLGAAAAFVTNPILLQLGVITAGGYGYGRRRRDTTPAVETETEILRQKLNELAVLEKYMSEVPQAEAVTQEKRLLANYLSCSGITTGAGTSAENQTGIHCLERLTCELHRPDSVATELERHVMGIVTSEILLNEFVPMEVKNRVKNATSTGADSGSCSAFPCFELEGQQP